jgi:hypothetical protein
MENQLHVDRVRQTSSTKSIRLDLEASMKQKIWISPIFLPLFMSLSYVAHIAIVDFNVR